jgi:hypothetical protein
VHSLNHITYARTLAEERAERVRRARPERRTAHPPSLRRGAARATARLARRLDAEVARGTLV